MIRFYTLFRHHCLGWSCLIASCLLFVSSARAQSVLTVKQIMEGPEFVGHLPNNPQWTANGALFFNWNPEGELLEPLYSYDFDSADTNIVTLEERRSLPSFQLQYNLDRTSAVYAKDGDLFLWDLVKDERRPITQTRSMESQPQFLADGYTIFYESDHNLYTWNGKTGATRQITDFRKGKEPTDPEPSAQDAWLERDQLDLFDILRERKEKNDRRKEVRELLQPDRPAPLFIGNKQVQQPVLSPDGKFVVYGLREQPESESTMVPDFVTISGYTKDLSARAKVGHLQSQDTYWIYAVQLDTHYQIDVTQLPGIYDKPEYFRAYHRDTVPYVDTFSVPREVGMHAPVFTKTGSFAAVVFRSDDNKDRWIMTLDLPTGDLQIVDHQRDTAWIGGPGISGWNASRGNIGWLEDAETLWFQSEETGFSHLYTFHIPSRRKQALTSGAFEILDARLSQDGTRFFVHANRESPFEQHFYHVAVTDGSWTRITSEPGKHEVVVSPDESRLVISYSYANRPTELYWMENRSGGRLVQITNSTRQAFAAYPWSAPEIIRFRARDGVQVPARIYRPSPDRKNGAAVLFVHGAGYLQNVHRWWSSYYREYMFHHLLRDLGYTVLDIDYRGSAGYGRDWRTAIYRHMGGQDLEDQVDGALYLSLEEGIDPERIGIYGGSYGGFITIMAMCTQPGVFACGAALRSVTDWAHYNHPYTSNILNTPVSDSIAYRRSSPIYFAEGLQGPLLMLHGMVDVNVQYQDVVRLAQRFIELGKEDWELAVFPMEDHGFVEASSWADEYRRILELFNRHLLDK